MSKRKKRKFTVEFAGRRWTAEGYYNSPSDCKRAFIRDLIDSPDDKVRLRVNMGSKKQFIFLDCVFDVGNPEFWPDDKAEFKQWALDSVRKRMTVTQYRAMPDISEETKQNIDATLASLKGMEVNNEL